MTLAVTSVSQCRLPLMLLLATAMAWPSFAELSSGQEPVGQSVVSVYDSKTIGHDTTTWCATQDSNGVFYIGGDQLLVADGDRWKAYPMGTSYAVRSLEFGPDGRLWAAGMDELGWFVRTDTGGWTYHSLRNQLPDSVKALGDVWNVYPTADGAIYVSDHHVFQWNGSQFKVTHYEVPRRLVSTRYNGAVYVYHPPTGLLRIDPSGPVTTAPASSLGPNGLFWMGEMEGKTVYATSGGIGRIIDGQYICPDPALTAFIRKNILTSARSLPDGSLALGTYRGGIAIVGPDIKLQRILNGQNGLPTDHIEGLYVAQDGALWATADKAIFRIRTSADIAVFDQNNGIPATGCLDIVTQNQLPIVLTSEGIMRLNPNPDAPSNFANVSSRLNGNQTMVSDKEVLLIGGIYGIHALRDGSPVQVYETRQDVFKIHPAETAGWFNASVNKHIVQFSPIKGESRVLTNDLPDIAADFALDDTGRLWISTWSKGLLVAQPSNQGPVDAEPASLHHGLSANEGYAHVARLADTIIGIIPHEAYWLNPKTDLFETIPGFPVGNTLVASNQDDQGRVFVALEASQAGMPSRLGQLVRTPEGVKWTPLAVEGLAAAGTPRALHLEQTDAGNVLWVAGSDALLRIKRPEAMLALPPRQPLLRALVRGDSSTDDQPITGKLPYSTKRLYVQFSSTEFGLRDTLCYQTMLEGVDQNWSAPTNAAELELANLREGDYNLKVRLIADSGLVSEAAVLQFSIATPWWRTPYGYAGYVCILGLVLSGLYQLRIRNIRHRAVVLERTVSERTEELEKANAAKTEFVASMSHEIRNPMNGIIGSAHALAETPLNEEQQDMVDTLRNCATFLSSLVEDVLDFSSIEAGVFTTQKVAFNPAEIIESAAAMLTAPAVEAGAHFDLDIDPALPSRMIGDPARIQQIVVNYATNALKFSGGGRVRLSVSPKEGDVIYAVTDDGPGISTDDQSVLFTRFSRLKTARNAGITGTGLGLAVCRAVAERMNGSVGVASSPGRGATFYLRLPLDRAGAETEIATRPTLANLEGARVLVVEDLAYNSKVLSAMLGKYGLTVDLATHGRDALCKFAVNSYHAVFLDYDLPDMSGLEVARRMRSRSTGPSRPLIVATTAYSTVQDSEACIKAGMDLFLSKPITPEKLQSALAKLTLQLGSALPLPGSATQSSEYNLHILTYLAGDKPGALATEIKRFLDSVADVHAEIRIALRKGERTALAKAAHRMLSHARMIEDDTLANVAGEIEIEAGYADPARLELLGSDMAGAVTRLRKTLARHRSELTPA